MSCDAVESPRNRLNVLIICTGNSCRSILAEVLFNELGAGRVSAFSAGSRPKGHVHPGALRQLEREGHPIAGLASKNWDEFAGVAAPELDIVITVCDSAAGEDCPLWRGSPVIAHWGLPDPAVAPVDEGDAAFAFAYRQLSSRIEKTLSLPLSSMLPAQRTDALHRIHDACQREESECISS